MRSSGLHSLACPLEYQLYGVHETPVFAASCKCTRLRLQLQLQLQLQMQPVWRAMNAYSRHCTCVQLHHAEFKLAFARLPPRISTVCGARDPRVRGQLQVYASSLAIAIAIAIAIATCMACYERIFEALHVCAIASCGVQACMCSLAGLLTLHFPCRGRGAREPRPRTQ
jgi:hypothetical protein